MKRLLPDIIVIAVFALLSFAYFFPADTEGRILFQHDTEAGAGAGHEAQEYYERTGERTRWTNTLFGGMPTYQISPSYDSTRPLSWAQRVYQLFLPNYVYLTFIMMLGFYILLRAFGIPAWYAGIGGLLHPHLRRTHLEVHHPGLHPAHDRRHGAGLPRAPLGWRRGDRPVRGPADCVQPRADVLLLPVRHALPGHCLWRAGVARGPDAAVRAGHRRARHRRTGGRGHQPLEPLSHLYVQQGNDARPQRADA